MTARGSEEQRGADRRRQGQQGAERAERGREGQRGDEESCFGDGGLGEVSTWRVVGGDIVDGWWSGDDREEEEMECNDCEALGLGC